jgi:hypothetical protein
MPKTLPDRRYSNELRKKSEYEGPLSMNSDADLLSTLIPNWDGSADLTGAGAFLKASTKLGSQHN